MSIASAPGHDADPFASGGLDALLASAARDCPEARLVFDDEGVSSASDIARRMTRLALQFQLFGLVPGERVLIVAGAQACALVALAAALRARLVPVLAPCGLGPIELAAHAHAADAVALVGPSTYGALHLGETYLSAAALSEPVRIIATQGPDPVDGAADISFAALDALSDLDVAESDSPRGDATMIGTFQGPATAPRLVLHRQATLLADALSLVDQAHINPSKRLIVTLPPSSLAGLVAGPFAALIGASSLVWHGPFSAARFLAACDVEAGAHLVVPAALGATFGDARFGAGFGSLILVSRHPDAVGFVRPDPVARERPIVDLYAFGETSVLAQRRVDGGVALPPVRVPDKSPSGGLGARLNRARAEADAQLGVPGIERA